MPRITAVLHTENDARRLGRCLETLHACDEILIVDHGSRDATTRVAHQYGARVMAAMPGFAPDRYFRAGAGAETQDWILCLDPRESLTEGLCASLFEWKAKPAGNTRVTPCSFFLREETARGWVESPTPQTRLVPPNWNLWNETFPLFEPSALILEGELLRFVFP